jgi:hypothetical protein
MAFEQRKRFADLGGRRREYAVQPELVRSLADTLARTVAAEQRGIVEGRPDGVSRGRVDRGSA